MNIINFQGGWVGVSAEPPTATLAILIPLPSLEISILQITISKLIKGLPLLNTSYLLIGLFVFLS